MSYLLDTNILLRLAERTAPEHKIVRSALRTLWQRGETLHFTSQNLAEFWNVCTRPAAARGGLGLSITETDQRARLLERQYSLLPDNASVHTEWRGLLVMYGVKGLAVYDARRVASMIAHGVTHLLTIDTSDFARYQEITVVHPQDVS